MVRAAPRRLSRLAASTRGGRRAGTGILCAERGDHLSVLNDNSPESTSSRPQLNAASSERPPRRRTRSRQAPRSSRIPPRSPSSASAPRSCRRWPRPASCAPSPSRSSRSPSRWPARTSSARPAPAWARPSASACRCCSGVVPPSEQPAATAEGEAADRTKDVPQALVVVPTRELCVQVAKDLADAGPAPRRPGHRHLRRPRLRAAARRPAQGRRRRRRHPRPAARPRRAAPPRARPRQGARARRGRRDAGPGLPARRRADHADAARASGTRCCSRPRCPARSSRCPARS